MHSLAVSVFLILATGYSTATSLQETLSLVGGKFEHGLNYDGAQDSEGIKRQLDLAKDNTWQFFYFCENGKNKKICGSWVDANGNKIKGANNNVKRTKESAILSELTLEDAGHYTRVPENKDENQAYLERVHLNVVSPPPPPKY